MLRASVVIPTYRRKDALLRALRALGAQSIGPEAYEVVVVVDGSDDGTREAAEALATPYALRVLWQRKAAPRHQHRNNGLLMRRERRSAPAVSRAHAR